MAAGLRGCRVLQSCIVGLMTNRPSFRPLLAVRRRPRRTATGSAATVLDDRVDARTYPLVGVDHDASIGEGQIADATPVTLRATAARASILPDQLHDELVDAVH